MFKSIYSHTHSTHLPTRGLDAEGVAEGYGQGQEVGGRVIKLLGSRSFRAGIFATTVSGIKLSNVSLTRRLRPFREICWLTSLDEFKNQRIQTHRTFQDNVILLEFGAPFSAWFHTSVA